MILPEQDVVLAINSAEEDMQAVLDAAWAHLLPAFGDAGEGAEADAALADRLAAPRAAGERRRGDADRAGARRRGAGAGLTATSATAA